MKIADKAADILDRQGEQLHQAAAEARNFAEVVSTDSGQALMAALRLRESDLANQYDKSQDYETVCRIQGQRMEARRLLLLLEAAPARAASLQKAEQSWAKKLMRLVRRTS